VGRKIADRKWKAIRGTTRRTPRFVNKKVSLGLWYIISMALDGGREQPFGEN
jgi:hypothetical protein